MLITSIDILCYSILAAFRRMNPSTRPPLMTKGIKVIVQIGYNLDYFIFNTSTNRQ